jgi:hypothetical protein
MVVILLISVVIVMVGVSAARRLWPRRRLRPRKSPELPAAADTERVTPLPTRRPRITDTASRFRQMSAASNVKVLADYRKARANRIRPARVASGLPRGPRPRRPEPA